MSEVSIEEKQGKEAMDLAEDQNKNKHILAALLEDSGLDLNGGLNAGSFMSMLKAMSDPDFTKKIFETLKDMSAGGDGVAGIAAISGLVGATNDNKGADNSASDTSPEVGGIQELRAKIAEIEAMPENERLDIIGPEFMDSLTDKQQTYMAGMMIESLTPGTPISRLVDAHENMVASGKDISEVSADLDEKSPIFALIEEAGSDSEKLRGLLHENAEKIENETGMYMGSDLGSVEMTMTLVDVKQSSEEKASSDLGGVDGTAVTYITPDKPADVQVEGSPSIKAAVNEGSSIVTGAFNNNVTAEGTQVSATVDQDAVAKVAPIDPALDGQDPNVVDALVVNSM